jgi:hypothetical protein
MIQGHGGDISPWASRMACRPEQYRLPRALRESWTSHA